MLRVSLIVLMLFLSFNADAEYRRSQKAKSIFKRTHPALPLAVVKVHVLAGLLTTLNHWHAGVQIRQKTCNGRPNLMQK